MCFNQVEKFRKVGCAGGALRPPHTPLSGLSSIEMKCVYINRPRCKYIEACFVLYSKIYSTVERGCQLCQTGIFALNIFNDTILVHFIICQTGGNMELARALTLLEAGQHKYRIRHCAPWIAPLMF